MRTMVVWSTATAEQLVREAARLGADPRLLVSAGCACVRVVLPLTHQQDRAVCAHAVETAERWTRGEATEEECRAASWAAEWAVDAAARSARAAVEAVGPNASLVHDAARSVLTREVWLSLQRERAISLLRTALVSDGCGEWFDERVACHEFERLISAVSELDARAEAAVELAEQVRKIAEQ